jgi:hypothetical protein
LPFQPIIIIHFTLASYRLFFAAIYEQEKETGCSAKHIGGRLCCRGKCIARVDGKVIFIEGAVPADTVDVYLRKNKKDWAEGCCKTFSRLFY